MPPIKVLMVDDEAQFRETTSKILKRRGFETQVAGSGEEAIGLVKQSRPDVVVLDIKMPGMDGHEALKSIKSIDSAIQVIMLTGHGRVESARKSLEQDAFDYLAKPCDIERLTARIHDAYNVTHKGPKSEKKARDIMISLDDYTTIGPDQSVREGIQRLQKSFDGLVSTSKLMQTGHRSILVLDETGEIVGVLSIVDLIAALRPAYLSAPRPSMAFSVEYSAMFWSGLFTSQSKALANKKIKDVMSPPPPSIDGEANLMDAANLIYTEACRRLIVRVGDKAVGVLREQEIFFELANIILEKDH